MLKIWLVALVAFVSFGCGNCEAQNINVSSPFSTNTTTGGTSSGSLRFGNSDFSLGFNFARGSSRQSTTTTPSLTTQNGAGGSLFSGQVSPFVTGVVPVVGQGGDFTPRSNFVELPRGPDNGVTRALQSGQLNSVGPARDREFQPSGPLSYSSAQSTAASGERSVSAIKAERQRRIAAQHQIVSGMIEAGQALEQQRQYVLARSKYREALSQTEDREVKAKINALIKATRLKD